MVSLQATISASFNVIGDLRPGIDEIIARLEQISPMVNDDSESGPEERLRESADCLVSHARSIVVQTEAATSISGEEGDVPDFLGWRPIVTRPMTVPPTLILGTEKLSVAPAVIERAESEEEDSGTDCDVDLDIIENWLVLGRQEFENENYERAKSLLTNGINRAKALPDTRRNDFDVKSSELTLAACFFHLDELDEARSRLQSLVQDQKSARPSPYVLRVQHLLTQVLFHQGHLEEAEAYGARVLNGRSRFRRDSPESYYETAALISAILLAQGRIDEAEVYRMLDPSSTRLPASASSDTSLGRTAVDHSVRSTGASPETLVRGSVEFRAHTVAASETSTGLHSIDTPLTSAESMTESMSHLQSPSLASTRSRVFSEQSRQETMTSAGVSPPLNSPTTRRPFWRNPLRRGSSNGRPAELCRGTTAIKQYGLDEGMRTVHIELPNYITQRHRACRSCRFRSASWYANRTGKPGDPVFDNGRGLRYKFSFLAAAHVACETTDAIPTYKCVICRAEQSDSDVSRTENELIEHVTVDHAYKTSTGIQKNTKCFFGSIDEETPWSVRMPDQSYHSSNNSINSSNSNINNTRTFDGANIARALSQS